MKILLLLLLILPTSSFGQNKAYDFNSLHDNDVIFASFSPAGEHVITVSRDSTAKLWNFKTQQVLHTLRHAYEPNYALFSPNGKYVLTTFLLGGTFDIWDVKTGTLVKQLSGHKMLINSVQFSQDEKFLISASDDNRVKIWEIETGENVHTEYYHKWYNPTTKKIVERKVFRVGFNSNHDGIILAVDEQILLKNWKKDTLLMSLAGHSGDVLHFEYSPDMRTIISASTDGTAILWSAETGEKIYTLAGHKKSITRAHFSKDGMKILTSGRDGTIMIWEKNSGEMLGSLNGHSSDTESVEFSRDGKYLLTAASDGVHFWDLSTFKLLYKYDFTSEFAQFSPDGNFILSSDSHVFWKQFSSGEMIKNRNEVRVFKVEFLKKDKTPGH